MSDTITLAAETRDRAGKGASRSLRREGRVPAVIYGQNKEPAGIHLEEKELVKALMTGHFFNSVVMLNGERTLPKDVAFHPVTDRPLHVDFLRIGEHSTVTVAVPVVFTDEDESRGLKQGGVLNITRHEVELVVDAANIPAELTISLKGREIGDSIHISDVALPKGAQPAIEDRDFAIATIVPPTVPTAADEAADADAGAAGDDTAEG
ncbi:50S ribosomal protein L25/general stress protein Ctc [Sphingomonas carotinifaciens]|uniref:Large ribosomal subunit protein bL25 n=1 Tax=Sphingomonas carotinifaciens TaxID=1166323 RepID=A0A1G7KH52_9SPHN|nr:MULTISPECIES: 50S ribosomal protein L25/general stress protein Ctc [Sphingomonas]MBB4085269.1 large subunit ribosomal protein L25 [Sphingomonas carotinifaciens]MWC43706.1 50S ribosomal protein L25/general stress protein Ctc [Sphingomonas carotinifaciens]SDF36568.1 large subunit ribosomal protein L25 [Sphingomonas carotinifaciens]